MFMWKVRLAALMIPSDLIIYKCVQNRMTFLNTFIYPLPLPSKVLALMSFGGLK